MAVDLAKGDPTHDPRPILAAGIRMGLSLGLWEPTLAEEMRQQLEREIARATRRPPEQIESSYREQVGAMGRAWLEQRRAGGR
jgi:hypothetical protein